MSGPLLVPALEVARRLDHSVYDCLYTVVAVGQDAEFVSDDRAFLIKLRQSEFAGRFCALSEFEL
jgi:predicted nucleic acid-binding protein